MLAANLFTATPERPKKYQNNWKSQFSTRIKDAGIAIRHSRGWILLYTAGSRNQSKGGHRHKKKVDPKKNMCFVIGEYFKDVSQDEEHVLDLLEAIMRPTFL